MRRVMDRREVHRCSISKFRGLRVRLLISRWRITGSGDGWSPESISRGRATVIIEGRVAGWWWRWRDARLLRRTRWGGGNLQGLLAAPALVEFVRSLIDG